MRVKTGKSVSRLLWLWAFLLLLILKEAFPKPAYAFLSSLDSCAAQPACASAISSEVAPAVAAPTGAGFGASTLSTTTATGTTSTFVKAVADAVILATAAEAAQGDASWHYWGQGINTRAQSKAMSRYCAPRPRPVICGGLFTVKIDPSRVGGSGIFTNLRDFEMAVFYGDGKVHFHYQDSDGRWFWSVSDTSILEVIPQNPTPWKDWSQEERSIAVAALKDSDWQDLISSMPEGGRLKPGDKVNAPINIIPGQQVDDPNTPVDERLPTKISGSYTNPDPDPNSPPPEPEPEPEPDADGGGAMEGGGYTSDRGSSAYSSLVNELRSSGINFTEANIVYIGRDQTGKIVWLETGNDTAGLQHIVKNHKSEFEANGILENQIPDVVMRAVTTGRIVGYQSPTRPLYEVTFNGKTQHIAVTVSSNGFIVGANPNPQ